MRASPSVIRWGEILKRTGQAVYEDDCLGWAAELAFFWFLALFPNSLRVPRRFAWVWVIAEWPLVFGLLVTALGWVYYFAPDVRRRWKWITPGSIAATLLWMLASLGFKWYADHFGEYQKTYGAIGGVIVALLWLYVSGLAILIGAELNAVIEHAAAEQQPPGRADVAR